MNGQRGHDQTTIYYTMSYLNRMYITNLWYKYTYLQYVLLVAGGPVPCGVWRGGAWEQPLYYLVGAV